MPERSRMPVKRAGAPVMMVSSSVAKAPRRSLPEAAVPEERMPRPLTVEREPGPVRV